MKALKFRFILTFIGLTVLVCAPVSAVTVYGELEDGDPTFNRPVDSSPFPPCSLSPIATAVRYDSYSISHTGGNITISMLGVSNGGGTLSDPFLVLYSFPFNPASPCANALAVDDDNGGGLDARIVTSLPAGVYVIVATAFSNSESDWGSYTLEGNWNLWAPGTGVPALNIWSTMLLAGLLVLSTLWRRRSHRS